MGAVMGGKIYWDRGDEMVESYAGDLPVFDGRKRRPATGCAKRSRPGGAQLVDCS